MALSTKKNKVMQFGRLNKRQKYLVQRNSVECGDETL